jgi:NADH-quinone oxidoreductase subunit I
MTAGRGLLKGLALTFRTMFKTPPTVQYPHEKIDHAPRTRGVIALKEENCTVCMLCARECPVWCIFIEGYKDQGPPRRPGGKPRMAPKLDRFDIDYSLCMYCGICVEVCPFDALFWSPEYEYGEPRIADLLHDKTQLGRWMETVPEKPALEEGAEVKASRAPRTISAATSAATTSTVANPTAPLASPLENAPEEG